jgi:hypothetical protein
MLQEKENFLKNEYVRILRKANAAQPARWGKMDLQQMIEHMRDVFKVASGKIVLPLLNTDPEKLEKQRAFIMTDQPFRENTRVPVMPEEPRPHKYGSIEEAIAKLEPELNEVFVAYASDPQKTTMNPVFGELDYGQQINLLHKHALHHLRQFGLAD